MAGNVSNNSNDAQLNPIIITKKLDRLFVDQEIKYTQVIRLQLDQTVSYRNQSLGYVMSVFNLDESLATYPVFEAIRSAKNQTFHRSFYLPDNVAVPIFFTGSAFSLNMKKINYGKCALAVTRNHKTLFYTATNKVAGAPDVFTSYSELVKSFSNSVSNVSYLGWSSSLYKTKIKIVARAI